MTRPTPLDIKVLEVIGWRWTPTPTPNGPWVMEFASPLRQKQISEAAKERAAQGRYGVPNPATMRRVYPSPLPCLASDHSKLEWLKDFISEGMTRGQRRELEYELTEAVPGNGTDPDFFPSVFLVTLSQVKLAELVVKACRV